MANPLAVKGALPGAAAAGGAGTETAKTGASQFDKVRENMRQQETAGAGALPPAVTNVSADQTRVLASDLRKKIDATPGQTAQQMFAPEVKKVGAGIEQLSQRIGNLPQTSPFEPIRARLSAIEQQYQDSNKLLSSIAQSNSPRDLLKMQVQIYQVTQNIEIVSKVVDEANSGVKQILQTQVSG
jgi:hypothetical protein